MHGVVRLAGIIESQVHLSRKLPHSTRSSYHEKVTHRTSFVCQRTFFVQTAVRLPTMTESLSHITRKPYLTLQDLIEKTFTHHTSIVRQRYRASAECLTRSSYRENFHSPYKLSTPDIILVQGVFEILLTRKLSLTIQALYARDTALVQSVYMILPTKLTHHTSSVCEIHHPAARCQQDPLTEKTLIHHTSSVHQRHSPGVECLTRSSYRERCHSPYKLCMPEMSSRFKE